jgi:hypothetical protein
MNERVATTPRPPFPAVSIRRQRVQRRVATHRAVVGDAWTNFEQASVEAQAKVHRVIDWTRTLSAIAALIAAGIALRRVATRGHAAPAVRAVALASFLRRVVPTARKLFSPYP